VYALVLVVWGKKSCADLQTDLQTIEELAHTKDEIVLGDLQELPYRA